jgi:hypothetical protein
VSRKKDIDISFDEGTRAYYIIWEPLIIGMGKTVHKVLEDLRQAAHFGVDTLIDLEIENISTGKGD